MSTFAVPDALPAVTLRRRLLAGAAILAAVVVAALAANWVTASRSAVSGLRAVLDDLDANDPGWRLHDIEAAREEVPDPENSARLVIEVLRSLPPHWVTRLGGALRRGQSTLSTHSAMLATPKGYRPTPSEWTAKTTAAASIGTGEPSPEPISATACGTSTIAASQRR